MESFYGEEEPFCGILVMGNDVLSFKRLSKKNPGVISHNTSRESLLSVFNTDVPISPVSDIKKLRWPQFERN